jgi:hypothetical protein
VEDEVRVKVFVGKAVTVFVGVGNSVGFTPHAESAKLADVMPATFRKSLRESIFVIFEFPLLPNQPPHGLRL